MIHLPAITGAGLGDPCPFQSYTNMIWKERVNWSSVSYATGECANPSAVG